MAICSIISNLKNYLINKIRDLVYYICGYEKLPSCLLVSSKQNLAVLVNSSDFIERIEELWMQRRVFLRTQIVELVVAQLKFLYKMFSYFEPIFDVFPILNKNLKILYFKNIFCI